MVWSCLSAATAAQEQERVVIVGSGSNLPIHLYQAWASKFNARDERVQVRYVPLGTSESIRQITQGIGDFGGGEVLLSDEQMHGSKISLISIPASLVAIVPIYNLPGKRELNFSGELLAQIYLGAVKNWKDPRIAQLNPGVEFPDLPIRVFHRSAGKGSNFIFTGFLSKTNPWFRVAVGQSPSPRWPLGLEAERGEDMVKDVTSNVGAIGYVDLNFARNSRLGHGRVKNAAGHFVRATPASIEAACAALDSLLPSDFRLDMTNAPGTDSYPIASFTWIYLPRSSIPSARTGGVKQFLIWSFQDGQKLAVAMGYAPLPDSVAAKARAAVNALP